jgi:type IV pilus assembly protein PilC
MTKSIYTFAYHGFDANGHAIKSYIHAEHMLIAKEYLISQGIVIQKIRKTLFAPRLHFTQRDLLQLTQQFCVLITANLPLIFCLNTIAKPFKPMVRTIFKQIIMMIEQGAPLNAALQLFPFIFPHYFVHLLKIGEESGRLPQVLTQLAQYQEKIIAQVQQLKKALLYPAFVFATSIIITLALLLFIVPQFQLLFADVTNQLPLMTRLVFYLSDLLRNLSILSFGILFLFISIFYYFFKYNERCQHIIREVLFHLPFIGNIIHASQQIHYLRSLSVALQAGLPLTQCLKLSADVMHNTRLAKHITHIPYHIESGMNLKQTFLQTGQFCDIVIQLVAIGEQSGHLAMLLAQSAHILEQQLDKQIQQLTTLLQPILIVTLGVILGGLIIALYLPVFKLGTLY